MKCEINNRIYEIKEKSREEMFGSAKEKNEEDGKEYLGLHFPAKNEIWLLESLNKGQKEFTLRHELMHAYIWCYTGAKQDKVYDEEEVCNISSNSSKIINDIVKSYLNK